MTDKDFESHEQDSFVNEMIWLARTLSNTGNETNQKVEVNFTMQTPGDPTVPRTICTLRYYPPESANLVVENAQLKAEIAQLKEEKKASAAPAKRSKKTKN
jgi:hypothetical protein